MAIRNNISDEFRERSGGKIRIPVNSKPATDNFHVDRSRLGTHEEYDPTVKNDWGGTGKYVEHENSIMDNVRGAMGGLAAHASYRSVHEPNEPTLADGSNIPSPDIRESRYNPLMRRRGDD